MQMVAIYVNQAYTARFLFYIFILTMRLYILNGVEFLRLSLC